MLHSIVSAAASAEESSSEDISNNLMKRCEELYDGMEEIEMPQFTLQMIIIINTAKDTYVVDFDTLYKYIKCNKENVQTVIEQLCEEYGLDKDDIIIALPCKDYLKGMIEDLNCCSTRKCSKLEARINQILFLIDNFKKLDIKVACVD